MTATHDALVIGGGPAGSTAALLLARAGWSVAVAERKGFPRRKVCGEYLSGTSLPLLDRIGVGGDFRAAAGPAVRRVGLFAGGSSFEDELPHAAEPGRALGRETLDTLLLRAAAGAGAEVWQPWSAAALAGGGEGHVCELREHGGAGTARISAPVVIAAHGSWDCGPLLTQPARRTPRVGDLFGFKVHFRGAFLPPGLMPLLCFPGGYGGLVHTDEGRVSLSCCVRRDRLASLRRGGAPAGTAVLAHIFANCAGARRSLAGAIPEGPWLASGPLRPGIHASPRPGIFLVGNAAGEAHPAVAEGISMAMQGAALLAESLLTWRRRGADRSELRSVGDEYARAWRRAFAPRLRAAAVIAHWAMRPAAVAAVLPLLGWFPGLLGMGARLSGKTACPVG